MRNSFEKQQEEISQDKEVKVIKKEKKREPLDAIDLYTTDKENFCREEELSRISDDKGNLFTKKWECGCYSDSDGKKKLCDKHSDIPQIERRDYVITKKSFDGKWLKSAEVSTTYMDLLRSRIEKSLEENKGMWQKIWDVADLLGVERE